MENRREQGQLWGGQGSDNLLKRPLESLWLLKQFQLGNDSNRSGLHFSQVLRWRQCYWSQTVLWVKTVNFLPRNLHENPLERSTMKISRKSIISFLFYVCVYSPPPKARKLKNRNYRWINREQRNSGGDNPQKGWKREVSKNYFWRGWGMMKRREERKVLARLFWSRWGNLRDLTLHGFSIFALKQKMRLLLLQRILEAGGSVRIGVHCSQSFIFLMIVRH